MTTQRPADATEARETIARALAERQPLEVIGGGSKHMLGRPLQTEHVLDMSGVSGILDYEPSELVLTARAGTTLAEVESAVAGQNQMLAFEPPDLGRLLGAGEESQTLGGILGANLSGPRRPKAGAARDHFLGFHGINGRAEAFKAGGKVVKNVTGYDLSKLMAGSFGTLAVLTEVTVKVLPRPEKARTVLLFGADDAGAIRALAQALNSPHEVSAAAHLPAGIAARSAVSYAAGAAKAVTAVRVEGPGPSVVYRAERLQELFRAFGPTEELHSHNSRTLWREIGNVELLADPAEAIVWRIALAPTAAAALVDTIRLRLDATWYYDWGGGLVWLAVTGAPDGGAATIRGALPGGYATLIRGPAGLRASAEVFQPLAPALARVTAQVKAGFDPHAILNPGRMYRTL
jgi:glycolate oxidase FAD binding subunit